MTWSAFSLTHSTPHSNHRITISSSLARSLALVISGSGAFHVIVDRQTLRQTEREGGTHGERALQPRREGTRLKTGTEGRMNE